MKPLTDRDDIFGGLVVLRYFWWSLSATELELPHKCDKASDKTGIAVHFACAVSALFFLPRREALAE